MLRVGVIGVGSIGSVLAEGFDRLGHDVVINDVSKAREKELHYPARPKKWIALNCDLAVIAVPTPTSESGGDATAVDGVLEDLHGANATVLIRSTMPPGETGKLAEKHDLPLVYSPEFLRDRSDVSDFFDPDRIVLSGPKEEREFVRSVMDDPHINCDTIIETESYLSAEIGKEAHNAYFATKVSFANQMRAICERGGGDVQTVMDIVTADSRNTDSHLDPLLGPYGGKCLPKDTKALTLFGEQAGSRVPLLRGTMNMNEIARDQWDNVDITGTYPNISVEANDD